MDKILEKLCELVRLCEIRLGKVNSEKAQNAADHSTNEKNKKANEEKDGYLKSESEALDKKKLIVSTVEEAELIKKNASKLADGVKTDREVLERDQKVHADKVKNENKDIERRKEKCSKDRKALDRDRENYKAEVVADVTRNIKKEKNKK